MTRERAPMLAASVAIPMRDAGPPEVAHYAASEGAQRRMPQAWGSPGAAPGRPSRAFAPSGGQRSGAAASEGVP